MTARTGTPSPPPLLPERALRVRILQVNSDRDAQRSLAAIERRLGPSGATDLVALPEVFAVRGHHDRLRAAAESIPGPTTEHLARWARRLDAWILGGSLAERRGRFIYNTSILLDRAGKLAAVYRKRHLFAARLTDGATVCEADLYQPGRRAVITTIEGWRCGLSICFDVRFPEDYRAYAAAGTHLLFIPSDFTKATGSAHWKTLVRARAIETQCFVIAPNQCGSNRDTKIPSFGHSLAVDPWGTIMAEAGARPATLDVTLDPQRLTEARSRIVLDGGRP